MLCPDCKTEMEEEAGYDEEKENIYASYSCLKCPTVFSGYLWRDVEATQSRKEVI